MSKSLASELLAILSNYSSSSRRWVEKRRKKNTRNHQMMWPRFTLQARACDHNKKNRRNKETSEIHIRVQILNDLTLIQPNAIKQKKKKEIRQSQKSFCIHQFGIFFLLSIYKFGLMGTSFFLSFTFHHTVWLNVSLTYRYRYRKSSKNGIICCKNTR